MSEVLASLKKIGGSGEQYTETVLWTNPDTSATFAAQNVTLSDSLSNYKYIGIRFAYGTSYKTGEYISTLLETVADFRKFGYNTSVRRNGTAICISDASNKAYERMCIYISDTSVRFNTCYQSASNTQANSNAIPLEILGINELAHGTKYTTNYDVLQLQTPANTNADFTVTTKGKPISITLFCYNPSNGASPEVRTNTNPSTGVVDNTDLWRSTNSAKTWENTTIASQYWTVTDNSITFQPVGSSRTIAVAYTYE